MLLALVVTVIGFASIIFWRPPFLASVETPLAAMMAALKWDILLVICLAGNIAIIARHRFITPEDMDGSGLTEGTARVRVYQASLQNTLEQMVLAIPTHAIWAVTMPRGWQGVIAVAAVLFLVGRLLFWRGYASGASARALGFALTFYPSLLMLLMLGVHLAWAL
jgi:hypothetical protein